MPDDCIRVLLADDHALFRDGVASILESEPDIRIVGQCGDGMEVLGLIDQTVPDVVVLDISLPSMNGLDLCREVTRRWEGVRSLIVTMHSHERCVIDALENGASGYLLKAVPGNEFAKAIRAVAKGELYLGPGISSDVIRRINRPDGDPYKTLTPRERQVLQMLAEGNSNRQVGAALSISAKTVDTHRARLMQKLDLHSPTELLRFALQRNIVSLP